jgi:hypothetical protein
MPFVVELPSSYTSYYHPAERRRISLVRKPFVCRRELGRRGSGRAPERSIPRRPRLARLPPPRAGNRTRTRRPLRDGSGRATQPGRFPPTSAGARPRGRFPGSHRSLRSPAVRDGGLGSVGWAMTGRSSAAVGAHGPDVFRRLTPRARVGRPPGAPRGFRSDLGPGGTRSRARDSEAAQ